jgi:hypothetical protein
MVVLATIVVFAVLLFGKRQHSFSSLRQMKLAASGSGDHGVDPDRCATNSRLRQPGSSVLKTSLYANVLSHILVWLLFVSFCSALPWWRRRMMVDDVSARHMFLEGWNCNFSSYGKSFSHKKTDFVSTKVYILTFMR